MASKMKQLHLLETEHVLLQNKASDHLLLLCQCSKPHAGFWRLLKLTLMHHFVESTGMACPRCRGLLWRGVCPHPTCSGSGHGPSRIMQLITTHTLTHHACVLLHHSNRTACRRQPCRMPSTPSRGPLPW